MHPAAFVLWLLGERKSSLENQANDVRDVEDMAKAEYDSEKELCEILVAKECGNANEDFGYLSNNGNDEEQDFDEKALLVKPLIEGHDVVSFI